jgi:glycolate oxidase iron-sulfur subunit
VYHYEASKAIGARKVQGLKESGAELIATACPGCIMQLQDSINHAGLPVRAVHILELLSEALK